MHSCTQTVQCQSDCATNVADAADFLEGKVTGAHVTHLTVLGSLADAMKCILLHSCGPCSQPKGPAGRLEAHYLTKTVLVVAMAMGHAMTRPASECKDRSTELQGHINSCQQSVQTVLCCLVADSLPNMEEQVASVVRSIWQPTLIAWNPHAAADEHLSKLAYAVLKRAAGDSSVFGTSGLQLNICFLNTQCLWNTLGESAPARVTACPDASCL